MFDPFVWALVLIVGLSLFGYSIGIAMLVGSIVFLAGRGFDTSIASETLLQGLFNSYTLLSIPLFILAADIMNAGSLADRLLRFSQAVVGRFRGGLGHVNVFSSLIFSGMSGSAIADAVGMGRIIINMMTKNGQYSPAYAAAITAASATIGPIIPPSIPMVLYALVSDTSIGFLFAAGILPGLLMGVVLMVMNGLIAKRRGFPRDEVVPLKALPGVTFRAIPALLLPVILLGGIYGGIMTPTEAAAVAAAYALVISVVVYRSVSAGQFYTTLLNSARSTAAVGILIAGALAFNYVITRQDVPASLAMFIQQFDLSPVGFLIAINLLMLALGCVLEGGAILLIIVPIFIPTAQAMGIDLVHFGVVVVVNAMLGLITPPYGLLLFVVANITGQPVGRIIRELLPFLGALFIALGIITFVPDFVLFLPRLLGYRG
ncbi:TRAP transporter large permease [Devosia sp. J2-20]|jgi:C4-dicarboxylate transporter DctM subunit|uniref:TRAP transporter large permease n=1 Tax=Devosia TaxID=46913 RepID=UPI0022AF8F33|nr:MULTISPECIES: TRAP transporter large permease [Devosia]MCZ4345233.1 TRAP transporter large permease [Devosia neptuniae]WDQ98654.1 TRAP transporter large permease [Devosia sp. J2-20]|tara:strand:- start:2299 stop:3594 length:1296 start_codon:yes stop_codon:yes gene_type:complete